MRWFKCRNQHSWRVGVQVVGLSASPCATPACACIDPAGLVIAVMLHGTRTVPASHNVLRPFGAIDVWRTLQYTVAYFCATMNTRID